MQRYVFELKAGFLLLRCGFGGLGGVDAVCAIKRRRVRQVRRREQGMDDHGRVGGGQFLALFFVNALVAIAKVADRLDNDPGGAGVLQRGEQAGGFHFAADQVALVGTGDQSVAKNQVVNQLLACQNAAEMKSRPSWDQLSFLSGVELFEAVN